MAESPPFTIDADLLYERCPEHHNEKISSIDVLDEFLNNYGRVAKLVEPCKIRVNPKISVTISSAVSSNIENVLQWNDIKQVHALTQSHPKYNNVISIWSAQKIYLLHLKSHQNGNIAAYINATQASSSSLFDSQKETELAMLEKCFEELGKFSAHDYDAIQKMSEKLTNLDNEIRQLSGKKRIPYRRSLTRRIRNFLGREVSCLEQCLKDRESIFAELQTKRPKVHDTLVTIRHSFLMFTRLAPTLQRVGYCSSSVEFGRRLIGHFANAVFCAKVISSTTRKVEEIVNPEDSVEKPDPFQLIASINSPPLTDAAIKAIETYLPERLDLASDWPKLGRNWSLSIHEQEVDHNDWNLANQQYLKEISREVEILRATLRRSYQQLIEKQLIAEVELSKRLLQDRLKEVEEQKNALSHGISHPKFNDFLLLPVTPPKSADMQSSKQLLFLEDIKQRKGRAAVVIRLPDEESSKFYDKEFLEILEETPLKNIYRVRKADGIIGSIPTSDVVEMKIMN